MGRICRVKLKGQRGQVKCCTKSVMEGQAKEHLAGLCVCRPESDGCQHTGCSGSDMGSNTFVFVSI